jgi:hypothetical protein
VPFLLTPPQPVLALSATANSLQLGIGNGLGLLTYQIYHAPAVSAAATWDLLTTGLRGQTNFVLNNASALDFFQVGVLTNY